ncbi:DUF2325 domain-containing protein [Clostridium oryzae]|nr:DUF2325 domain-containing protein [Clostridium oryzae]
MSLVLIGGHDRMYEEYRNVCNKKGHKVKIYTQMPARFDKAIGYPDRIVLFTSTVSHKMIRTAIKEARKKNIPVIRCTNSSSSSLSNLLEQL